MDAPTSNTPAVVIGELPKEKDAPSLDVSCNAVAHDEKTAAHISDDAGPTEPPIRLPQDWSSKRKWLIVTAISGVSFIV
jgi:hypothetical protein